MTILSVGVVQKYIQSAVSTIVKNVKNCEINVLFTVMISGRSAKRIAVARTCFRSQQLQRKY